MQGLKLDDKHWHDHVPKLVSTSHEGKVTTLRNQQVRTDRTNPSNKPDIIIRDNKQGTCMLTDAAIPGDRNNDQERSRKDFKIQVYRKRWTGFETAVT